MGCFDATCFISGLSIRCGDPAYGWISRSIYGENFFPEIFRLEGTYNDYGLLENIKPCSSHKYTLEVFQNLKKKGLLKVTERAVSCNHAEIETFQDVLTIVREGDIHTSDSKCNFNFVMAHKDVYDAAVDFYLHKENHPSYFPLPTLEEITKEVEDLQSIAQLNLSELFGLNNMAENQSKLKGFYSMADMKNLLGYFGSLVLKEITDSMLKNKETALAALIYNTRISLRVVSKLRKDFREPPLAGEQHDDLNFASHLNRKIADITDDLMRKRNED